MEDIQTVEYVKLQWDRIHIWMEKNSPGMLKLLLPGAPEKAMRDLEAKLEIKHNTLPIDFVTSYCLHNGSTARFFWGSIISNSFLSIDDILKNWLTCRKTKLAGVDIQKLYFARTGKDHVEVQTKVWSSRWIPFGSDGVGDLLCIDLDPTKHGNYGQVVHWTPYRSYTALRAHSFAKYLANFATDMENGKYSLSRDGKYLVSSLCVDHDQYARHHATDLAAIFYH